MGALAKRQVSAALPRKRYIAIGATGSLVRVVFEEVEEGPQPLLTELRVVKVLEARNRPK